MKNNQRAQALMLGATLLGTILLPSLTTAEIVEQTVTQPLGANWNQAAWGTPAAVPVATNDYVTPAAFDVRTPDSQTASSFLGNSLRIETGGRLLLKNGGAAAGVATVNLQLNGGSLTYHTANGTTIAAVAGSLQVLADSVVNSTAGAVNTRDIWLRSTLSGGGGLGVALPSSGLVLLGTNTGFSGNWTVNAGRLELGNNCLNALGSGTVTVVNADNALTFNATNDLVVANVVEGAGSVVKLNTNTVTLGGNNTVSGSNVIASGVLRLATGAAIATASVVGLAGGTLDASLIGGLVLNDSIGQSLNSRGKVVGNLTAASGTSLNFDLNSVTNDVLEVTGSLTLLGNPALKLNLTGFKNTGVYRLINYSGSILGGGSFSLVPPPGSSALFGLDTTIPGQVNLTVTNSSNSLTWVGDGAANFWDTVSPNWAGASTLYADGDSVTFNDSGSASPNIYVNAVVYPRSMTVSNTSQIYIFDSAGIVSDGLLTKKGANELVFINPNNFTGPISIESGVMAVGAAGTTGSLGNPGNITNHGVLRVNLAGGVQTFSNSISGPGSIEVTGGGATVNLRGTNFYTGLTTVDNECQLHLATSSALGTTDAGTTVLANGRLGITTFVGAMTLAEPLTLNGGGITTGNNQGGALLLTSSGNNLTLAAPITIASDARVRAIDLVQLTFANTVAGNNVGLRCSVGAQPADAGALMTFANSLALGSGALTKDGQGVVAFESGSTVAGSTIVNEGTLLAKSLFNGGPVTVNASGTLGGSGTILGIVAVAAGGTLAPGNAGIGTLTLNNTLTLAATATTRMEINRTNAQTSDLLVASTIPLNGTLTVVNTGPALEVGDTFNLFDGAVGGAFTATNLPALALPSHGWSTSNLLSQGTITVISNALPLLPFLITDVHRQPGNVTLTWNSYPGRLYTVEYSLSLTNWSILKTGLPANTQTNTTTAVVDTTGADSGLTNTLVQYRMGTVNAQLQDAGNLMAAGGLVGVLSASGGGLSLFNANALVSPAYPNAPQLQVSPITGSTDLASAMANSTWFTFELTVGTNLTDLDLTSLSFNGARGGGASPRGYGVYVTTPTTVDEPVQGAVNFATQRPVWSPQNIDLSGIASLQNLAAGQVVTFKIPIFAPAPANSVEIDDITVRGNITPGPVLPFVGSDKLYLRMKQQ